jgi:hypothetical protein
MPTRNETGESVSGSSGQDKRTLPVPDPGPSTLSGHPSSLEQPPSRSPSEPSQPDKKGDGDGAENSHEPPQSSEDVTTDGSVSKSGPCQSPRLVLRLGEAPHSSQPPDNDVEMDLPGQEQWDEGEEEVSPESSSEPEKDQGGGKRKRKGTEIIVPPKNGKRSKSNHSKNSSKPLKPKSLSSGLWPVERPKEVTLVPFEETKVTALKDLSAHYVSPLFLY